MTARARRGRRAVLIAVIVLVAVVVGAAVELAHLSTAGEVTTPVLAAPTTATPTPGVLPTSATTVAPSPTPTAYPGPLAQAVVERYWAFISRGQVSRAFDLLSTGAQTATTRQDFVQSINRLLVTTNGLTATVGVATVQGDAASVPVTLHFTKGVTNSQHTQQLVWEGTTWRIDESSGPAPTPTPGG